MPRSGAGVFSKPAGTTPTNGDDIDAPQFNTLMDDIAADLNLPRPIVAGGTGASTADTALAALGGTATGTAIFKAANAAAVQTTVGLVPQSSATDNTAGRLLTVGAFGLGGTGAAPLVANIDTTTTPSAEYRYDATTTGTFPTGITAANGGLLEFNRITAAAGYEVLMPADQNTLFFRRLVTTFFPWQTVISVLSSTAADGDTIARQSGIWARVAKGTAGQVYRQNDALTAPVWSDALQMPASQATTSGTAFDFTGIPAWVKRITLIAENVSLSGSDIGLVQLGTSGGFVTTGYVCTQATIAGGSTASANGTTGFYAGWTGGGAETLCWTMRLTRAGPSSNTWIQENNGARLGIGSINGGGYIALAGALTQVRFTRSGTNTFDSGSITILYE